MTQIISVINQKGGVGKSTTALALLAGLKARNYKVLGIDLDAQQNLTYATGASPNGTTALGVLTSEAPIQSAIQLTAQGDIIPASKRINELENLIEEIGKAYRLKEVLEPVKDLYDYIIIDTPPALSLLTTNALTASDGAIIPAQADIFSLQAIENIASTIEAVKKYTNANLTIKGILLTRYSDRTILSRNVAEMANNTANRLQTKVFNTTIREAVAIREAQIMKQSIFDYAPNSKVAEDYNAFIDELLK